MLDLLNSKVKHATYGIGMIIDQTETKVTVEFDAKTCQFQYPAAFGTFIKAEDPAIAATVQEDIEARKRAEADKKAVEEAKQAAEAARKAKEELERKAAVQAQIEREKTVPFPKAVRRVTRISGRPQTYLVFQGDTYEDEHDGGFIWAPMKTKDGKTMHHWDRLLDVREGDVIFHCSNGYIQAISRAVDSCEACKRPYNRVGDTDWTQWENDGRMIRCDYTGLRKPLKHGDYKQKIMELCYGVKYSPFSKYGEGNMGYLFDLNPELARFFLQKIVDRNPEVERIGYLQFLLTE